MGKLDHSVVFGEEKEKWGGERKDQPTLSVSIIWEIVGFHFHRKVKTTWLTSQRVKLVLKGCDCGKMFPLFPSNAPSQHTNTFTSQHTNTFLSHHTNTFSSQHTNNFTSAAKQKSWCSYNLVELLFLSKWTIANKCCHHNRCDDNTWLLLFILTESESPSCM